jgi:desulfoferrodoxin-like iron-binding protein
MSILEQAKKHQPGVEIQNDKIKIQVGYELVHPMTPEHLIDNIMILKETPAGWIKVKEFNLTANDQPIIEINKDELEPGHYKAQARCNLHGTWEEEFNI